MTDSKTPLDINEILESLDLNAIADFEDKLYECQYFLALASSENDVRQFRWLISAFFNAAYSFFETSALYAYNRFTDPKTGDIMADGNAVTILESYVTVKKNPKTQRVDTSARHPLTKELYSLRNSNTHHFAMSIMTVGTALPEDFHFGQMKGKGKPALSFCWEVMALIVQVQSELDL